MLSPAAHPPAIVVPSEATGPASSATGARAFAPNVPAGTWAASALPVTFVVALPSGRDVGADAEAELDVALRAWSRPSCTSWRARVDPPRALTAGDDGVNGIFFHDEAWPADLVPGAIAQTVVHVDANGHYRDADIHLNGAAFRFSVDGAPGTQDLQSVLVHELGHALGLGHSSDARATMYASGSGLRWRSLEADDVAGACALYPRLGGDAGANDGGANDDASCDVLPCPSPFLCVAGACQRPRTARDVCAPCERVSGACEAAGDDARCIDIGEGALAGRVCGRACTSDATCGAGFTCRATSGAGDHQCVSLDGCATAANACASNADCARASGTPGTSCRGGACVGPADAVVDAGPVADASGDAIDAGTAGSSSGGGCDCASASRPNGGARAAWAALVAFAVLAAAVGRRTGRR